MHALEQMMRRSLPETWNVDLYLEQLAAFPENEWFAPNNGQGVGAYDICRDMASCHLIARRDTPIWSDGSFRGVRVEFYYSHNLKFENEAR